MSALILLAITSLAIGYAIGLLTAARIAKAIETIAVRERKRSTGVAHMGHNATPITEDNGRNTGVVRPKLPKQPDDGTKAALASARRRVNV